MLVSILTRTIWWVEKTFRNLKLELISTLVVISHKRDATKRSKVREKAVVRLLQSTFHLLSLSHSQTTLPSKKADRWQMLFRPKTVLQSWSKTARPCTGVHSVSMAGPLWTIFMRSTSSPIKDRTSPRLANRSFLPSCKNLDDDKSLYTKINNFKFIS